MTENEAEVLVALKGWALDDPHELGARPMDLGGATNSHHSLTLSRMVKKGWAQKKYTGGLWGKPNPLKERNSCRYRITPAGVEALANHRLTRAMAKGL